MASRNGQPGQDLATLEERQAFIRATISTGPKDIERLEKQAAEAMAAGDNDAALRCRRKAAEIRDVLDISEGALEQIAKDIAYWESVSARRNYEKLASQHGFLARGFPRKLEVLLDSLAKLTAEVVAVRVSHAELEELRLRASVEAERFDSDGLVAGLREQEPDFDTTPLLKELQGLKVAILTPCRTPAALRIEHAREAEAARAKAAKLAEDAEAGRERLRRNGGYVEPRSLSYRL